MLKQLTFIFFLFSSLFMSAQSGILSGRVLDESRIPLTGATLVIENVSGTISNVDGYYSILNLPSGSYILNLSYIGYEDQQVEVEIIEGQNTVRDFQLRPGVNLQEIVVTSQIRGQARALSTQKSNYNITNIIASDQIGRFPDANIGDAVKRIPGINVQYDQGEARFGNIRGTAPQLNSITVNGERIPSAEAEVRSIQLDLIPSDMIQAVEVSKAVTPDMDADAIGGSINLVTRSAPYEQRISGTLGTGYNILAEKPTYNGSLIFGDRFANNKLGVIFSASYFDNNLGSDNLETEWTYDDANDNDQYDQGEEVWPEEIQVRQYYLQRTRQSYSLSLDYKLNPNHSIYFKGILNQRKDWENRYRAVYKDIENDEGQWIAELERETKGGTDDIKNARLENQKMMNYSLSGEHLFGQLKMNWSGNYAKASEDRPNERYLEMATDGTVPVNLDFSNSKQPTVSAIQSEFNNPSSAWELSAITEEFQYTTDEDFNGRLDFELPLANGSNQSKLKFGGRIRTKTKVRNNDFYEFEPNSDNFFASSLNNVTDFTKNNFLAGNYQVGSFVSKEFLGALNLNSSEFEKEQDLSELAGNFDATENIFGGYAMINQNFGERLLLVAGLRVEQSKLSYTGFIFDDEEETLTKTEEVTNDYLNVLPGLHLKYNLAPNSILRFAFTNTLSRPNYFDLVPYRSIEDGEDLAIGNPNLKATTSMNFDLMAEHYFKSVGIVSGGVFFKDISDFIVNQTFSDYTFDGKEWSNFTQPINGGNAQLFGFEMAFQRQLDFISPILSGVGLYFNYTYISSEVTDFNFEGRENDKLSLPGSPKHTLNTSLAYEGKRFTSRISLNYASDFIDEVGEEIFTDRYYDQATYLDLNLSYSINPKLVVYANANNLLNQPLRYFQGVSDRTMQAEYYNVRFDIGIKFDLIK